MTHQYNSRAAIEVTLRILVIALLASLTACSETVPPQQRASEPTPSGVFLPTRAKDVRQKEGQGVRELTYVVAEPYPASQFLCELTNYLENEKWQGLREDVVGAWAGIDCAVSPVPPASTA